MSDLTAEQIQHGRGLDRTALAARRRLAHEMRSVRERIASTSGLGHAFDVELLRQFAQAQISAVPLEMVLLGSITAIAIYWVEPTTVLRWVITVLVGLAVMVATGRRLLGTSLETA
ncbi:MAG: sensor histidine kinase, partial [Hyphomicrobiales bacterium]|nr:sensor histidine kinase [Hyphomicrobiales bacterium]